MASIDKLYEVPFAENMGFEPMERNRSAAS